MSDPVGTGRHPEHGSTLHSLRPGTLRPRSRTTGRGALRAETSTQTDLHMNNVAMSAQEPRHLTGDRGPNGRYPVAVEGELVTSTADTGSGMPACSARSTRCAATTGRVRLPV